MVFHGSTFSQTKLASRFSPRPPGDDVELIVGAVVGILFGSIFAYGQRSPVFGLVIVGLGLACAGVYVLGSGRRRSGPHIEGGWTIWSKPGFATGAERTGS